MGTLGYFGTVLLIGVPAFLLANLAAQRIYPTKTTDQSERRAAYKVLVMVLAGGLIGAAGLFWMTLTGGR